MSNPQVFSDEQSQYITYDQQTNTRLMAQSGSGKTASIIARMLFLIEEMSINPQDIIMITFSKNAQQDFVRKLRRKKIHQIEKSNILTIDALAWRCVESPDSLDVCILSYAFMLLLQSNTSDAIKEKCPRIANIRHVFVDEAQDLNQTQYNILMSLKDKLGIFIHLVGDANQSIYQFRNASDTYLMNFEAKTFYLTKNFRSCEHIVEFSSFLRPYADQEVSFAKPKPHPNMHVKLLSHYTNDQFEDSILYIIKEYIKHKIPLEKCAILAPTRGKIRSGNGMPLYTGLCYISNLLFQNGIPCKQFYDENGSDNHDASKIDYKPVKGHINLMTYTGSKGLEWDNVFIVDAKAYLINGAAYTEAKFMEERYLLYVACSRAIKNMFIFSKIEMTNPWFDMVPPSKYKSNKLEIFDRRKLNYSGSSGSSGNLTAAAAAGTVDSFTAASKNVTGIISSFGESTMYDLSKIVMNSQKFSKVTTDMDPDWGEAITSDVTKACLMGKVFENYFLACSNGSGSGSGDRGNNDSISQCHGLLDLRNIISNSNIIHCNNRPNFIRWYFANRSTLTWELFDIERQKDTDAKMNAIINDVEKYMDRSKPFNSYTILDKFHEFYIVKNITEISEVYSKCVADPQDFEAMFEATLINHALQTHHYFYIEQIEELKESLLTDGILNVGSKIEDYCKLNMCGKIKSQQEAISEFGIRGVVDFVDENGIVSEIKCVKSIMMKHVMQPLFYTIMMQHASKQEADEAAVESVETETATVDALKENVYNFIIYNLFNGKKYEYEYCLDESDVNEIVTAFTQVPPSPGSPGSPGSP